MIVVKNFQTAGFSLIELVTVMLLLGILSVVALGRFNDQDQFAARGFFDDTLSAVRFAQKLAISSGCDVQVVIAANNYELRQSTNCTDDDFTSLVDNPADRSKKYQNPEPIPTGFTLTAGFITFNARGEREEVTSDFTLSGGATSYSFRVHDSTGLVEVI